MQDSGSTSSASQVYQKLVPRPVRTVAMNTVPVPVRRTLKKRLDRALAQRESRLHQRALRRLRTTDFSNLPEGRAKAPDGRVGHVHSGLTADLARRTDLALVTAVLDRAKIPWFSVPALDDRRMCLAVAREHKGAVRRVLRALLERQTGYVVSVSPGKDDTARIPGSHVKAWKHFGASRVIRLVWLRTDPTGSLWVGENQGVEIEFWTTDTTRSAPRLVGPRPNRVQRVVPADDPQTVEIPHERLTGYADTDAGADPTRTRPGFDVPRVEEVTFPVDAAVLWCHDAHEEPWAGELLRATLRSLHQYAPWTDMVHVLALAPVPEWVHADDRLRIVPAGPDAERNLHAVPGLADRFLYFRPGALLGRPVRPFDYFTALGGTRPRRGPWSAREAAAPWTGWAYSFTQRAVTHGYAPGPQPYAREILEAVADGFGAHQPLTDGQYAPELEGTHPLDGVVHHAAHFSGHAEPSGEATIAVHAAVPGVTRWLDRLLVRRDAQQIQLCGLGSPDALAHGGTRSVLDFLRRYYPVPSPFERAAAQPEPHSDRHADAASAVPTGFDSASDLLADFGPTAPAAFDPTAFAPTAFDPAGFGSDPGPGSGFAIPAATAHGEAGSPS
ncbi:sugar phosphotransferase [Streptomyces sp. NBC_00536]|uniref:sugar phosphotransferase n=1 Tax=Streptomyces sp. NBC_00536 TaxID=2975769 RepID=UPI002E804C0B|nr:sugar phosphotransferase [Streptomyces sp. NBC_00536]WUC81928.1 sugar phosphotransferase [Streptomyces sp. NBC_00536]